MLRLGSTLVLCALGALACGGGEDGGKSTAASAQPSGSTAAKPAGPPCKEPMKAEGDESTSCELTADYAVGAVKCAAKGTLRLFASGSLRSCTLAAPVEVEGFSCQSGDLSFDEKGKVYFCSTTGKDIQVGEVVVPAGSLINPFGSGHVKFAECKAKPASYKDFSCKEIHFDDAGKVQKCLLASAATVGDATLPARTRLQLSDAALVKAVDLPADAPAKVKDLACKGLDFDDKGKAVKCVVGAEGKWNGKPVKVDDQVSL